MFLVLCGTAHAQMHEWAKSFTPDSAFTNGYSSVNAIDIDSNDNSYVVGYYIRSFFIDTFSVSASGGRDAFVSKIDRDGNVKWIKTIYVKNGGSNNLIISNIRVLANNRVVVYGMWLISGNSQTKILKLSPNDSLIATSLTNNNSQTTLFWAEYDSLGNVTRYGKVLEGIVQSPGEKKN